MISRVSVSGGFALDRSKQYRKNAAGTDLLCTLAATRLAVLRSHVQSSSTYFENAGGGTTRYGELARADNIAGFGIGPASANWSHSIRVSGNRVTASVSVTLRTVSPL